PGGAVTGRAGTRASALRFAAELAVLAGGFFLSRPLKPWRDQNLVMDPLIKGDYEIRALPAMKFAHHGLLGPLHHPNHAAFQPAIRLRTDHLHFNAIAVQRGAYAGARNKDILVSTLHRPVRNHKAITITMADQPSGCDVSP